MLAQQGVMAFINNRPEGEAHGQPDSASLAATAGGQGAAYLHIPMAGMLTPDILARTQEAFDELPRPIVAFCASGMRSAALWAFAHVKPLGVDGVLDALGSIGMDMPQLRPQLQAYSERISDS